MLIISNAYIILSMKLIYLKSFCLQIYTVGFIIYPLPESDYFLLNNLLNSRSIIIYIYI